jgi:tRNA nucleotidyltransferase (CCA-adding enzyme)
MTIPDELKPILNLFPQALIVGGAVRDHLLGLTPKDFDIEVYNTPMEEIEKTLSPHGSVDTVGKSFGVVKLTLGENQYDFSCPRRERKAAQGQGHREFIVEADPNISPKEAASRRDFTINALAFDPKSNQILDFWGGLDDLKTHTLRQTSPAFEEDPLRPLRAFQLAARTGFHLETQTAATCQKMAAQGAFDTLPKERVWEEWSKFLIKSTDPMAGFQALHNSGWGRLFPQLEALRGLPQDPIHHPEGDVLTHTALVIKALHNSPNWPTFNTETRWKLALACLCHDLGKATTTARAWKKDQNRMAIVSPGHDQAGIEPTKELLNLIGAPQRLTDSVCLLVAHHMAHLQTKSPKNTRQLAAKLSPSNPHTENPRITTTIAELAEVVRADHSGRPPKPPELPHDFQQILQWAQEEQVTHHPQKPRVTGKLLAQLDIPQGPAMGAIIQYAYKAQLKGALPKGKEIPWVNQNLMAILRETKTGPEPLLRGNTLIAMGLPTGKDLKATLNRIYKAQITGKISTEHEAKHMALQSKHKDEPTIN